jgi:hypothetical protein
MIKEILTIPERQCRIPTQLPVKYPELVRVFKEASRNLKNTFRDIEDAKNLKKNIGAYTESTDLIFKASKKIIHLVTLSL